MRIKVRALQAFMCSALLLASAGAGTRLMAAEAEAEGATQTSWKTWHADIDVANKGALQRGARNFANYCLGCHSLKYMRYSRLGEDLGIPADLLDKYLIPPGEKPANYILTSMPAGDAEAWFGKTPPDLSLMARARGTDYIYRLFKTYYLDPTRPTGANNLQLPAVAMPAVLSELEGLKKAVYKSVEKHGEDGALMQYHNLTEGVAHRAGFWIFTVVFPAMFALFWLTLILMAYGVIRIG